MPILHRQYRAIGCGCVQMTMCHVSVALICLQVSHKIAEIRTHMAVLLTNFGRSGDLANSLDHHDRDRQFFENFAKGQPMWFWIYLAWDHGRNVPAWNTSLLPDDESLELGVTVPGADVADTGRSSPPAKKSKKVKAATDAAAVESSELQTLMAMSSKWMDLAMKSSTASTASVPSDPEEGRTDSVRFLTAQIKHMHDSLDFLPATLHADVHTAIESVAREMIAVATRGREQ